MEVIMGKIESEFVNRAHAIAYAYRGLIPPNLEKYYQDILKCQDLSYFLPLELRTRGSPKRFPKRTLLSDFTF